MKMNWLGLFGFRRTAETATTEGVTILKTEDCDPIQLAPGDTLVVSYEEEEEEGIKQELARETVDRLLTVDRIVMVDVKNSFGLKDGMGAFIGEGEKRGKKKAKKKSLR